MDRYAPREALMAVLDKVYQARFEEAESGLRSLMEKYPEDPRPYEFLANCYDWWEKVCPDSIHGNDEMIGLYEKAVAVARQGRKRNLKDRVALTSLGNAHLRLTKKYRDKGEWLKTINSGSLAHRYLDRSHFLDKRDPDPKMGLGAVKYYASNLPGPVKPFAFLIGFGGSRAKGLTLLAEATQEPGFYQTDAIYLLADLYTDTEPDYGEGLKWYGRLLEGHPNNPDFRCSVEKVKALIAGSGNGEEAGRDVYWSCRAKQRKVC